MVQLHHDALRIVAATSVDVALRMGLVCTDWRDAILEGSGACDVRRQLVALGATALLTDVTDALALTPITVKLYPHTTKRRHGGGLYRIFQNATCIAIFHAHGGGHALELRLARREQRRAAQGAQR